MRLWTIHPKYLDPQGLVALWREALLAQKVLSGQTNGYKSHPQLIRFKNTPDPIIGITTFLKEISNEARRRGYKFDESKINNDNDKNDQNQNDKSDKNKTKQPTVIQQAITATKGQLMYEWQHFVRKLETRNKKHLVTISSVKIPEPNPLFKIVEGDIESWEKFRT